MLASLTEVLLQAEAYERELPLPPSLPGPPTGAQTGVKASGGIRTYKDALAMIAAEANRIGTSAGVTILHEAREKEHNYE